MRRSLTLLAVMPMLLCALAPRPVSAEELYVIEQLVVSLYSAPDVTGERVATVKSGDRVELIERAGEQVHVRTVSGREGWIRASYLQAAQPLRPQLAERTAEVARLKEDVSRLQAQLDAARTSAAVAARAAPAPGSAPAPAQPAEEAVREPRRGLFGDGADEGGRRVWPWAVVSALLALVLGFALGVLVLDRHIRRKYGGLRIY